MTFIIGKPLRADSSKRYTPAVKLGQGGQGTVYLADASPEGYVVVKTTQRIKGSMATRRGLVQRERNALKALGDLDFIPRFIDEGSYTETNTETPIDFTVMEYVPGIVLESLFESELDVLQRISPQRAIKITYAIAMAVEALHARGYVHLDIKPSNILLVGPRSIEELLSGVPIERAVLLDLGLTCRVESKDYRSLVAGFKKDKTLFGTPDFMAPERCLMTGYDDPYPLDRYPILVILFELCCLGTHPYIRCDGTNPVESLRELMENPMVSFAAVTAYRKEWQCAGYFPLLLYSLIRKGLARDRSHRLKSTAELRRRLEDVTVYGLAPTT